MRTSLRIVKVAVWESGAADGIRRRPEWLSANAPMCLQVSADLACNQGLKKQGSLSAASFNRDVRPAKRAD
jgi:hypothetical protein